MDVTPSVLEPGREFIARGAAFVPSLLAALLILVGGWMVAKVLRLALFRCLLVVRFDIASEKAGVDDLLARAEVRQSPAELVATLGYWLVLLLAVMTAASTLGLSAVSDLLNQVLVYFPKVIAAVVALILGLFLANFLAGIVRAAAANAGLTEADILATGSRYAIVIFTVAVTLEELGIAAQLVRSAFIILFGAVALALALAFGLGCKDLARDWMARRLEEIRARKKRL